MKILIAPLLLLVLFLSINSCKKNRNPGASKGLPGKILFVAPDSNIVYGAVTINGNNFDTVKAHNIVRFGGVSAIVNTITSTQMVVTIPNGAKTGKITITDNGKTITSPVNFKVLNLVNLGSVTNNFFEIRCDRFGNLYMQGANNIVKIINGTAKTIYTAPPNTSIHNGAATTNSYYDVQSFTIDVGGNIYVALGVQTVVVFDDSGFPPTGDKTTHIIKVTPGGTSSTVSEDDYGEGDMVSDSVGNIYLANAKTGVEKMPPESKRIILDDTRVTNLAVDKTGDLYENNRGLYFRKINAQNGSLLFNYPLSLAKEGIGYCPMACDKWNNLFIEEDGHLTMINSANYTSTVGIPEQPSLPGTNYPYSIAFGSNGHMYILARGYLSEYAFK